MNIYIITHYYPPESGAPQARLSELALNWKSKGHDITVLTCFPNHPTGIIPDAYKNKLFLEEFMDDVRIWRHWIYATPNKGILRKTLNHISFMISVILLSLFRGKTNPDIIIVSSPTFFSVISAYVYSLLKRVPFVFEVRDLWPGIFKELGVLKNKLLLNILEKIEMFLYGRSKHVITVTNGFKEDIKSRGIEEQKISVITNGANLKLFKPLNLDVKTSDEALTRNKWFYNCFKEEKFCKNGITFDDKFIVLYAGAHGISHALINVVETAKLVENINQDILFVFVGDGTSKNDCIKKTKKLDVKNILFFNSIEKANMPILYNMSDVCLVPLKNIPGFKTFIPSKMFEIMACGKPIIASLSGEAEEILLKSKSALVVPPQNNEKLKNAILDLKNNTLKLNEMGKNAYDFVSKFYDRDKLALKYLKILVSITGEK